MSRYQRIVGAERSALIAEMVSEYNAGRTVREIATAHEMSYGNTYKILRQSGQVSMRRRGPAYARSRKETP